MEAEVVLSPSERERKQCEFEAEEVLKQMKRVIHLLQLGDKRMKKLDEWKRQAVMLKAEPIIQAILRELRRIQVLFGQIQIIDVEGGERELPGSARGHGDKEDGKQAPE